MAVPMLAATTALLVQQHKEWTEILSGWETANRYTIRDPLTGTTLHAGELGRGFGATLARGFFKNRRPFTIEIRDAAGQLLWSLRRPWTWFFARLEVSDGNGRLIGGVRQRFALLSRRFSVQDDQGRELAEVHGPLLRPWTFHVLSQHAEVGTIRKRWSGVGKELFTAADNFALELQPTMSAQLRPLCLAATFLIDFAYFEHRD